MKYVLDFIIHFNCPFISMILFPFILCKYFLNGGFNTNIEKKVILIVMLVKIHHDTRILQLS